MVIEINHLAAFVSVARASGFRDAARKSGGLALGPQYRHWSHRSCKA
jgi:hypothetical protein